MTLSIMSFVFLAEQSPTVKGTDFSPYVAETLDLGFSR
jgi:hypothetical protein